MVNANDPKGLQEAIELFLSPDSKDMLIAFSNAGKSVTKEKYSTDAYIDSYLKYLQSIWQGKATA